MNAPLRIHGSAAIDGSPVFSQLDLTLAPGTWTCLLGASGVGKTTVLKLLAGLAEHVQFNGELTDPGGVALMAQHDMLLPWLKVLDNVLLGARLRGERPDTEKAMDVLARVGLSDHAQKNPSALSGGQRQRVALARTLMEDRAVVLLDEPFSALDALTRAQMQDLAAEVLSGRTVLLVTHDPGEAARLGQKIVIMTEQNAFEMPPPVGDIPRPYDDPSVLRAQADLLNTLRGTP